MSRPPVPLSLRLSVLLGLVVLLGALIFLHSPAGQGVERALSDFRLRQLAEPGASDAVVIVAIDEKALDVIGAWPWPRGRLAEFIARFSSVYQPSAIILDMVLPPGGAPDEDARLAGILQKEGLPPVFAGQLLEGAGPGKGVLQTLPVGGDRSGFPVYAGFLASSDTLVRHLAGVGHINATLDPDGRVRRVAPLLCHAEGCSPNLGLAFVNEWLGGPAWERVRGGWFQPSWRLVPAGSEESAIPLDEALTVTVPWRHPTPHLYVSAADVWTGEVDAAILRDRIVLVGGLALGLGDQVNTPIELQVPGVETHARFLSAWLAGSFVYPPRMAAWLTFALVGVQWALLLAFRHRPRLFLALGLLLAVLWGVLNAGAYRAGWALPIALPILFPLLFASLMQVARVSAGHDILLRKMAAYLPLPLVARLTRGEEPAREVTWFTVMYADIVGYTAVSRQLSPEQTAFWGNTGVDMVIGEIEKRGGHIDNIAGDGLLAYWRDGSPETQAERAVDAAVAIRRNLPGLNDGFRARYLPPLDIGLGLHAGPLMAGSFGQLRRRYTVLGEVANLAHRIERQTRTGSHRLLLSARVAQAQHRYPSRVVGSLMLESGPVDLELHTIEADAEADA
jgi:adenylate cyclase